MNHCIWCNSSSLPSGFQQAINNKQQTTTATTMDNQQPTMNNQQPTTTINKEQPTNNTQQQPTTTNAVLKVLVNVIWDLLSHCPNTALKVSVCVSAVLDLLSHAQAYKHCRSAQPPAPPASRLTPHSCASIQFRAK